MWVADRWTDYALLDASGGERLERWGNFILIRPDPAVVWNSDKLHPGWKRANARYSRSASGGGAWEANNLPKSWDISYLPLGMRMSVRTMGFKHTGIFPEQSANWEWMSGLIRRRGGRPKILNLFAYTGGASVAAALAGGFVTHVDAARGMVTLAKANADLSGVPEDGIRYIVDDCRAFIEREIRRGNSYDAIIMDPPSYGRGPGGQVWKLEEGIHELTAQAVKLLSSNPLFFLLNSYTTGLSAGTMEYILSLSLCKHAVTVASGELGLPVGDSGLILPCGSSVRAEFH